MTKDTNTSNSGCLKTIILFLVTIFTILFGGLALSKWLDTKARNQVDKNGIYIKAIVFQKNANSKGRTTWFKFNYKNKMCISSEGGHDLYEAFSIGDTIIVKVDTLDLKNTYVVFETK